MLQSYTAPQQALYEERGNDAGLAHYFGVAKRRRWYLLIPFLLILGVGSLIVAIQRPIYLAEGKILVESQDIPVDLVRPTVMDTANQRIQVIQQRIMTRDNLLTIVNKFGLFTSQRAWMSGTQLLDLMRERTKLQLLDLTRSAQGNNLTIALTLSFEYENPQLAMRVANEFLTLILAEDARSRTNRASETTKFLAREAKRLEGELAAADAQISELKRRPRTSTAASDQVASQLTTLKSDLVQKTALYSNAHPEVKALKRKIAGLEEVLAKAPPAAPGETGVDELQKQRSNIEKNLEEAGRKLTTARLGESLERDQQSERLQVIEQPTVPQKPVRPNRFKLLGFALALAAMAGVGAVLAAEAFDRSIRSAQQLAGIIDSQIIFAIPYITTKAETLRKKRKLVLMLGTLVVLVVAGSAAAYYLGIPEQLLTLADRDSLDMLRGWMDTLTGLSK